MRWKMKVFCCPTWALLDYNFIVKKIITCYHHNSSCMCISYRFDYSRWWNVRAGARVREWAAWSPSESNWSCTRPEPKFGRAQGWLRSRRQFPEHDPSICNLCNLLFLSTCALKLKGVVWNLSCMILGTYVGTLVCVGR